MRISGVDQIKYLLIDAGIDFETEYKFSPHRKWRFDIFIKPNIAIEYEGIFDTLKSRHTTVIGYSKDCEKYNRAAVLGFKVLRYTALTISDQILRDIREIRKNAK